ncbi:hypothetical protein AKO1_013400 [Acrasis kona]|uniref:Uncharacterized protein n=1 Tax=Acrasis kona TaxID=1008807 RepID=A0AAW2YKT3_9EUKA
MDKRDQEFDERYLVLAEKCKLVENELRSTRSEVASLKIQIQDQISTNVSESELKTKQLMDESMEKLNQQMTEKCSDVSDGLRKEMEVKAKALVSRESVVHALRKKATVDQLEQLQYQITHIDKKFIDSLTWSGTSAGRWIWNKSSIPKNSRLQIPWNEQLFNNDEYNFSWTKDCTSLTIKNAGVYEICVGLYGGTASLKKPTLVQININGSTVLSASSTSSSVVQHHNPDGNTNSLVRHHGVSGLTFVDFIHIPQDVKISASYTGDDRAQHNGFLSLKKLY